MSLIKPMIRNGRCYRTAFLVVLILLKTVPLAICAMLLPPPHFVYTRCIDSAGDYSPQSLFQSSLNSLLSDMLVAVNSSLTSYSSSNSNDVVHGFFYCRGDVDPEGCRGCVNSAAARAVLDCPSAKEAVLWYEECTLGYSSTQVAAAEDVWVSEKAPTSNTVAITPGVYGPLFDGLIKAAAYSINGSSSMRTGRTMVTSSVSLQGLVQCAPQTSESKCEECLRTSIGVIPSCCGWRREWVTVFRPSCLVEYRYANAIATNHASGTLLFPKFHSVLDYVIYIIEVVFLGVFASVFTTLAYFAVTRPIKYKLIDICPGWRGSEKPKAEEPKEPAKHNDRSCTVCKGVAECKTHKNVSCILCNITDEIQSQQRVPPVVCPPMPASHPGVMWIRPIPDANQPSYWCANHC